MSPSPHVGDTRATAPLKRHPALAPFSRDHHLVLQLARGLERGASRHLSAQLPDDPAKRRAHVLEVFDREIAPHFEEEETLLFAAVAGRDPALDREVIELEAEHVLLRALIASLRAETTNATAIHALLDRLGHTLEEHVRSEERSLFPRVQAVLAPWELDGIGERVERRLRVHPTG